MNLSDNYKTDISFVNALSDAGKAAVQNIKDRAITELAAHIVYEEDISIFTDDWILYITELGLYPTSVLIIGRAPNAQHPYPHYDKSLGIHDSGALNWVENNNDDSEMVWYDMPAHEGFLFPVDHRYVNYRKDELTEKSRACIGGTDNMALVRTDIPHNVDMGDIPRLAISVRFSEGEYTWAESVERMKEFII